MWLRKSTSTRNVSSFQHHILSVFLRQIPHYLHKGSKLPLGDEEGGSVGTRPNCPEKRVLLPPVSSSRSHLIPFFGGSLNVSIYAQKQPPSFPSSFYIACPRNPRGDLRCSPLLLLLVVKVVPCAKKKKIGVEFSGAYFCPKIPENKKNRGRRCYALKECNSR